MHERWVFVSLDYMRLHFHRLRCSLKPLRWYFKSHTSSWYSCFWHWPQFHFLCTRYTMKEPIRLGLVRYWLDQNSLYHSLKLQSHWDQSHNQPWLLSWQRLPKRLNHCKKYRSIAHDYFKRLLHRYELPSPLYPVIQHQTTQAHKILDHHLASLVISNAWLV